MWHQKFGFMVQSLVMQRKSLSLANQMEPSWYALTHPGVKPLCMHTLRQQGVTYLRACVLDSSPVLPPFLHQLPSRERAPT